VRVYNDEVKRLQKFNKVNGKVPEFTKDVVEVTFLVVWF
jgi:hypothetical protein